MVRKSRPTTVPQNEETDNEHIEKKLKKGDMVITSEFGRTKDWSNNTIGTVSKRRGEKVFVVWENTSFHIEDEMDIKEVRPYEKTKKSSNLVVD
jgi:ribosomal protein S17